jgi:hypothetical protein
MEMIFPIGNENSRSSAMTILDTGYGIPIALIPSGGKDKWQ